MCSSGTVGLVRPDRDDRSRHRNAVGGGAWQDALVFRIHPLWVLCEPVAGPQGDAPNDHAKPGDVLLGAGSVRRKALVAMVDKSPPEVVALCIESFSATPVSLIRKVAGLSNSDAPLQPQDPAMAQGANAVMTREAVEAVVSVATAGPSDQRLFAAIDLQRRGYFSSALVEVAGPSPMIRRTASSSLAPSQCTCLAKCVTKLPPASASVGGIEFRA